MSDRADGASPGTPDETSPAETALDPSSILRAIEDDQRHAQESFTPNTALLYLVWSLAWIVGFAGFYASHVPIEDPLLPTGVGLGIMIAALIAAIAFSAFTSARSSAGSRGPSMVQGAIFGNMYPVAFLLIGLLGARLAHLGVPGPALLSYGVAVTCLVVGLLFVAAALIWNDRPQLITGAWTIVVGIISVVIAPPHNLLAGILGGLGFLVIAAVQARHPRLTSGQIWRGSDD